MRLRFVSVLRDVLWLRKVPCWFRQFGMTGWGGWFEVILRSGSGLGAGAYGRSGRFGAGTEVRAVRQVRAGMQVRLDTQVRADTQVRPYSIQKPIPKKSFKILQNPKNPRSVSAERGSV